MVTRKYNQRTKEWNCKIVKAKKTYDYIPILLAKIFKRRFEDYKNPITQHVSLSEDDPARIAPTIARAPPVNSKELFIMQRAKTRFRKSTQTTKPSETETTRPSQTETTPLSQTQSTQPCQILTNLQSQAQITQPNQTQTT